MYEGTITKLLLEKGFGFIARPNQPDVFFHCRDVASDLEWSEQLLERRVRFDMAQTPRGPRAQNVRAAV